MQKRLTLAVVLIIIVAAVVYLENPAWLQTLIGSTSENADAPSVQLGMLENPAGDEVGLRPGNAAPDFALKTLDGDVVRLSDFRGEKFVIVNLWASWCGPCKVEMPDLESVHTRHDELVVLGVDLQESVADIQKFLTEEVSVSYPILLDSQGEVASAYNLFAQPTSILVDKRGVIFSRKNGAYTSEELDQEVEKFMSANKQTSATSPQSEATDNADVAESIDNKSKAGDNGAFTEVAASADAALLPAGVTSGALNEKFFWPGEMKQLGLDVDLKNVPYLTDLDMDKLVMGCPVVDCIASIDAPRFEGTAEVEWLADDDRVLAVSFNNIQRAYPVKILNWHEIVNDAFGQTPVVVSYCPLCNSALVFEAPVLGGQPAQFGVSGRLYYSDLVLYDRTTGSLWSQIERAVIVGPLAGRAPKLKFVPVSVTTWAQWREEHPQGEVLARPTTGDSLGGKPPRHTDPEKMRFTRDFDADPYDLYHTNPYDIRFPVDIEDRRLPNKTTVIGVEFDAAFKAYPLETIQAQRIVNDTLNGAPIAIALDPDTGSWSAFKRFSETPFSVVDGELSDGERRWTLSGKSLSDSGDLEPVLGMQAYWFAWAKFHPDTELFTTD